MTHRGRHRLSRTGPDARPAGPRRVAHSGDRRREPLRARRRGPVQCRRSGRCRLCHSGGIVQPGAGARRRSSTVTVGPGTLLGELALLTETTRPVTATAREPSTVMRISRSLFLKMLDGFPDAARRLRDDIAARRGAARIDMVAACSMRSISATDGANRSSKARSVGDRITSPIHALQLDRRRHRHVVGWPRPAARAA